MIEIGMQLIRSLSGQPWAIVALVISSGLFLLLKELGKNTQITKALASRIAVDPTKELKGIKDGVDLVVHRQTQIIKDVEGLKCDVTALKESQCTNTFCPNRVKEG